MSRWQCIQSCSAWRWVTVTSLGIITVGAKGTRKRRDKGWSGWAKEAYES